MKQRELHPASNCVEAIFIRVGSPMAAKRGSGRRRGRRVHTHWHTLRAVCGTGAVQAPRVHAYVHADLHAGLWICAGLPSVDLSTLTTSIIDMKIDVVL